MEACPSTCANPSTTTRDKLEREQGRNFKDGPEPEEGVLKLEMNSERLAREGLLERVGWV
jgi:hypothetical protein